MSPWPSRIVTIGAALFLLGSCLVLVSGHGGNSTGGSEWVWEVGGLMVYVSLPILLVAGAWALTRVLLASHRRSPEAGP